MANDKKASTCIFFIIFTYRKYIKPYECSGYDIMDPGYIKYNIKTSVHKFSKNLEASSQF